MADSKHHAEGEDVIPAQRFFNPSAERRISAVSEINVQGGEDDEDRMDTIPLAASPIPLRNPVKNPVLRRDLAHCRCCRPSLQSAPLLLSKRDPASNRDRPSP